jgi:glutamate-1-semialdehyde 2,1-aminomutase
MVTLFFSHNETVDGYNDVTSCDTDRYARFFHAMLQEGVYLPPSQFETWFVSAAHSENDMARAAEAARNALRKIAKEGV